MFLQTLLMMSELGEKAISLINLVASQLNLLLSLVNDVLDIKLIEQGHFAPKLEDFNPVHILVFIKAMFEAQAKMIRTKLISETVSSNVLESAILHEHDKTLMPYFELPERLNGDPIRLK